MRLTATQIAARLDSEAAAYEFMEELRWGGGEPVLPAVGTSGPPTFARLT